MKYVAYTNQSFKRTHYYESLPAEEQETFDILSSVFHFKVNNYVCENLIDWLKVPDDPIYSFVFPRREMLSPADFTILKRLFDAGLPQEQLKVFVERIRRKMAPRHISAEGSLCRTDGEPIQGMYSNFPTIVSLFPDPMVKTCHAYCNYCFRWIMFNNPEVQNNSSYRDPETPVDWLKANPLVSDALFTGADPLVLKADTLWKYIEPVLKVETVKVIRLSSKSLTWWPYRFTSDANADDLIRLFEKVVEQGRHLNFCAHITHPRELEHPEVEKAVRRIRNTGANIRTQAPIVKGVNDDPETWSRLWDQQIKLGMIPYYMFIEADHHPESCFRIPLARALEIFQEAQKVTTGLARTVRGPVFMYDLNRILLDGTVEFQGEKYFVLKTLQSPPGTHSEAQIKMVPYDEHRKELGDLFALFNTPEEASTRPL